MPTGGFASPPTVSALPTAAMWIGDVASTLPCVTLRRAATAGINVMCLIEETAAAPRSPHDTETLGQDPIGSSSPWMPARHEDDGMKLVVFSELLVRHEDATVI